MIVVASQFESTATNPPAPSSLPLRSLAGALLACVLLSPACTAPARDADREKSSAVAQPAQELAPGEPRGRVVGRVRLTGAASEPRSFEVDEAMLAICGHERRHAAREWLVDTEGGVANCVVLLAPLEREAEAAPTADAVLCKIGCTYEPRVLVVGAGSTVTLRNVNSPCEGFQLVSARNAQLHAHLRAGSERAVRLEQAEMVGVRCPVRPEMVGTIAVVATPYHALSDEHGRFELAELPAGRYRLRVWHEEAGWLGEASGTGELELAPGERRELELGIVRVR
jgi:hypothetical protein